MEVGGEGMFALLMLLELKNEIGIGSDPSVQPSFSFTHWWSDNCVSGQGFLYHILELMQD